MPTKISDDPLEIFQAPGNWISSIAYCKFLKLSLYEMESILIL